MFSKQHKFAGLDLKIIRFDTAFFILKNDQIFLELLR